MLFGVTVVSTFANSHYTNCNILFLFSKSLEICFSYICELFENSMHCSLIIFTALAQFLQDSAPISYLLFFNFFLTHGSQTVLPIYFWVCGHPLEQSNLPGSTLLERTNFPSHLFPLISTYHLLIASQLGWHFVSIFLSP